MSIATDANFPSGDPIDPQGRLTPQWRMFFLTLFNRTGGLPGIDNAALQSQVKTAQSNIAALQTDAASGVPIVDMAPVYGLIYVVEAMAAQAMSASAQRPDERGESGEASWYGDLLQRVRELEGRIAAMDAPVVPSMHDIDTQLAAGAPMISDTSQMSNGAGFLTSANDLSDLASAISARGNLGLGTAAVQNVSYFAAVANNLSDLANVATARVNMGLGSSNTPTFAGATLTDASANNTGTLTVSAVNSASGLNLKLTGNGSTNPTKYIQIYNGVFKIISSNFSTVLLSLDEPGNLGINGGLSFAPATTTTAPAAGSAGALPATPAGYATVTIGGTARKIAYY
ncbi:hypothetical protein [Burkholderia vietnamiensis]|uniref:hypothetical protein n=1 Tax=Burkholderia vietnamiensis TaxID=60552 RepID=UPI0007557411|nr:hypothetical protein [Burkholderia vietnamiensis]MCA8068539.1 hypothetical protein [Burkholderia vietnamiensis]